MVVLVEVVAHTPAIICRVVLACQVKVTRVVLGKNLHQTILEAEVVENQRRVAMVQVLILVVLVALV
jgi:hypothetical protein